MKPTAYQRARDAGNGRWVSLRYALAHKATTVIQTIRRKEK